MNKITQKSINPTVNTAVGFFVAAEGGTPIHPIGLGVVESNTPVAPIRPGVSIENNTPNHPIGSGVTKQKATHTSPKRMGECALSVQPAYPPRRGALGNRRTRGHFAFQ